MSRLSKIIPNLTGEWVSLIHTDFNIIKENMFSLQQCLWVWQKKGKSYHIFHDKNVYIHLEFQEGIWKITSEFCLWLKQGLQSPANVTQLLFLLYKKNYIYHFYHIYHMLLKKGRFYFMYCNPGALYMLFKVSKMNFSSLRQN